MACFPTAETKFIVHAALVLLWLKFTVGAQDISNARLAQSQGAGRGFLLLVLLLGGIGTGIQVVVVLIVAVRVLIRGFQSGHVQGVGRLLVMADF